MKNSSINERFSYLIENEYFNNQKKFAESIGFAPQVVFNIVGGRKTKPSFDVLNAVISTNDNICANWLLTGTGEMLKTQSNAVKVENELDYKVLYFDTKYSVEIQKKYISSLETDLGIKKNAG